MIKFLENKNKPSMRRSEKNSTSLKEAKACKSIHKKRGTKDHQRHRKKMVARKMMRNFHR